MISSSIISATSSHSSSPGCSGICVTRIPLKHTGPEPSTDENCTGSLKTRFKLKLSTGPVRREAMDCVILRPLSFTVTSMRLRSPSTGPRPRQTWVKRSWCSKAPPRGSPSSSSPSSSSSSSTSGGNQVKSFNSSESVIPQNSSNSGPGTKLGGSYNVS